VAYAPVPLPGESGIDIAAALLDSVKTELFIYGWSFNGTPGWNPRGCCFFQHFVGVSNGCRWTCVQPDADRRPFDDDRRRSRRDNGDEKAHLPASSSLSAQSKIVVADSESKAKSWHGSDCGEATFTNDAEGARPRAAWTRPQPARGVPTNIRQTPVINSSC
jgi:hypothetical protein